MPKIRFNSTSGRVAGALIVAVVLVAAVAVVSALAQLGEAALADLDRLA